MPGSRRPNDTDHPPETREALTLEKHKTLYGVLTQNLVHAVSGRMNPLVGHSSCIRIHGSVFFWLVVPLHQSLKMSDCFRCQEHVRTHVTNFRWDIFENKHVCSTFDGVNDETLLVFTGAPMDAAFHSVPPLFKGVTHFGDFGS